MKKEDEFIQKDSKISAFLVSNLDILSSISKNDTQFQNLSKSFPLIFPAFRQELFQTLLNFLESKNHDSLLNSSIFSLLPDLYFPIEISEIYIPRIYSQIIKILHIYSATHIDPGHMIWGETNNAIFCITRLLLQGMLIKPDELVNLLMKIGNKAMEDRPPIGATVGICMGFLLEKFGFNSFIIPIEILEDFIEMTISIPVNDESKIAIKYF